MSNFEWAWVMARWRGIEIWFLGKKVRFEMGGTLIIMLWTILLNVWILQWILILIYLLILFYVPYICLGGERPRKSLMSWSISLTPYSQSSRSNTTNSLTLYPRYAFSNTWSLRPTTEPSPATSFVAHRICILSRRLSTRISLGLMHLVCNYRSF
jgi:hypothetical protein